MRNSFAKLAKSFLKGYERTVDVNAYVWASELNNFSTVQSLIIICDKKYGWR